MANPITQQNQTPSDLPPYKQKALEPLPDDIVRKIFRYHDDLRTQALVSKAWLEIRNSDPGLLAIYKQLFNKSSHKEEVLSSPQYGRVHKAIIDLINKVASIDGGEDILKEIEVNSMNKKCYDLLKEWFEIKTTCLALLNLGETLPSWIQKLSLHINEETKQRLDQWKVIKTCSITRGGDVFLQTLLGENYQGDYLESMQPHPLPDETHLDQITRWIENQNLVLFFSFDTFEFIKTGIENFEGLLVHDKAAKIREKLNEEGIQRSLSEITGLTLIERNLTILPPEIGKLTALKWFCLNNNKLTTLPPEIGKLSALLMLGLNENNFTSIPIDWILSRPDLQKEPFLEHVNLLKSLRQFDAYISPKSEGDKFSNKVLGMLYRLHAQEESNPKWAENHLSDDLSLLETGLKETLRQEIETLRKDQLTGEKGFYWQVWDLAGKPTDDPLYGMNHCLDCCIRAAIAIARCKVT